MCEIEPLQLISRSLSQIESIPVVSRTKDFELVTEMFHHVNNGTTIIVHDSKNSYKL